jgi:subtilisin family serine protease
MWTFIPVRNLNAQSNPKPGSLFEKNFFSQNKQDEPRIVDGEIIVKYKKSSIDLKKTAGTEKATAIEKSNSLEKINEIKNLNIQLLKSSTNIQDSINALKNDPAVEIAEPNFKRYASITSVNDLFFSQQWDLTKIQATTMWDNESSSDTDVTVAVLDTGVYYNHEDLGTNMWDGSLSCKDDLNVAIPGGCPNHGWDYKDGDNDPNGQSWLDGTDEIGTHGTWVSGVLAATPNNSLGISGMSIQNNIKVMAIRFGLDTFSEIQGINFAKNNGVKIINASFGGPGYSQLEKNAITNFPGLFVAAAGNNSSDNQISHYYPSDYDNSNIISVAATDGNDALASFSNYGSASVDLAAPGTSIPTTYYSSLTDYALVSGTSFAAPLVAGSAAILQSKNPSLTITQTKSKLLSSGDAVSALINKIATGKRLNLNNAHQIADNTKTSVYRFWSNSKQGHFFTSNTAEKDSIIATDPSWSYEGIAWYVPTN